MKNFDICITLLKILKVPQISLTLVVIYERVSAQYCPPHLLYLLKTHCNCYTFARMYSTKNWVQYNYQFATINRFCNTFFQYNYNILVVLNNILCNVLVFLNRFPNIFFSPTIIPLHFEDIYQYIVPKYSTNVYELCTNESRIST